MSERYIEPFVPQRLVAEFDDSAREAHAGLAIKELAVFEGEMPPTQVATIGDRSLRYAELLPRGDYDPNKALVLHLPFANVWQPSMQLRAKITQSIAAPDTRMIIFPGNAVGERAYQLTAEERNKVAQGNFLPIAELEARLLTEKGIGWAAIANYSGYSGGASNGASLARIAASHSKVHSLGMFETPNVKARTKKELSKDFKQTGLRPLLQAVLDAQVPALTEAMDIHTLSNPMSRLVGPEKLASIGPKMALGLGRFGLSATLIAENRAIRGGMAQDNLSDLIKPIMEHQPETQVLIANAEKSLIMPTPNMLRHFKYLHDLYGDNVQSLTVDHYGHEMGDNIVVHALLVKKSLNQGRS